MEFRQLYYFLEAAKYQNFRRAAEICLIAQSALSRQIAALESELGVELFKRVNRRVILTEAGSEFATFARAALEQVESGQQAMAELKTGVRGSINIGCVEALATSFLPGVFARFHHRFPQVRLNVTVKGADELAEFTEQGVLDFSLTFDPLLRTDKLLVRELLRQPVQVVVGINHPFNQLKGDSVSLEQIAREPLVILKEGYGLRRIAERIFARGGIPLQSLAEIDSVEGLKEFVKQGIGISFMPRALIRPGQLGTELTLIPIAGFSEEFIFALIYRRSGLLSRPAREFLKIITEAT